jgi:hypothetical protein
VVSLYWIYKPTLPTVGFNAVLLQKYLGQIADGFILLVRIFSFVMLTLDSFHIKLQLAGAIFFNRALAAISFSFTSLHSSSASIAWLGSVFNDGNYGDDESTLAVSPTQRLGILLFLNHPQTRRTLPIVDE